LTGGGKKKGGCDRRFPLHCYGRRGKGKKNQGAGPSGKGKKGKVTGILLYVARPTGTADYAREEGEEKARQSLLGERKRPIPGWL